MAASTLRLAILGAECTGKSTLAHALAIRLHAPGAPWVLAGDCFSEWCVQHRKAPTRPEYATIANAQQHGLDALAEDGTSVIADSTGLMTAIYCDLLFEDSSLYATALEHQGCYDVTLVTGTDWPWVANQLQRGSADVRAAVDHKLRSVLQTHGIDYTVLYGSYEARLTSALESVAYYRKSPLPRSAHETDWKWSCDTCSDPECEHRLFSRLLPAA